MSLLRRRTSNVLATLFLVVFIAALVGAVAVLLRDPKVAGQALIAGVVAGILLARATGELRWSSTLSTGAVLGVVLTILGLGAYALYAIVGVSGRLAIGLLAGAALLFLVLLVRALLASGSADYPYDD